jgi:hypothetical protein
LLRDLASLSTDGRQSTSFAAKHGVNPAQHRVSLSGLPAVARTPRIPGIAVVVERRMRCAALASRDLSQPDYWEEY